MNKDKKRHITDCLIISAALIIIGIINTDYNYFYIAAALSVLSAFIPFVAKTISYTWQSIGIALGFVVSKVLLGLIFYCILFPVSLLQKLLSPKSRLKKYKEQTYWIKKENISEINFKKPW